jgi:hypothetical protein
MEHESLLPCSENPTIVKWIQSIFSHGISWNSILITLLSNLWVSSWSLQTGLSDKNIYEFCNEYLRNLFRYWTRHASYVAYSVSVVLCTLTQRPYVISGLLRPRMRICSRSWSCYQSLWTFASCFNLFPLTDTFQSMYSPGFVSEYTKLLVLVSKLYSRSRSCFSVLSLWVSCFRICSSSAVLFHSSLTSSLVFQSFLTLLVLFRSFLKFAMLFQSFLTFANCFSFLTLSTLFKSFVEFTIFFRSFSTSQCLDQSLWNLVCISWYLNPSQWHTS